MAHDAIGVAAVQAQFHVLRTRIRTLELRPPRGIGRPTHIRIIGLSISLHRIIQFSQPEALIAQKFERAEE
jgi:hypothetical protein